MPHCQEEFSDAQAHVIWLVTGISSILSLIGSSFMVNCYCLLSAGKNPLTKLVFYLSFFDFIASTTNIITVILLYCDAHNIMTGAQLFTLERCQILRLLLQFSYGASVGYTFCISLFLFSILFYINHKPITEIPTWILFHVISVGIPLVLAIIFYKFDLIVKSDWNIGFCFPERKFHLLLWFMPIFTFFSTSVLIYGFLCLNFFRSSSKPSQTITKSQNLTIISYLYESKSDKFFKFRNLILRFNFYIVIFFICWLPDLLTYFIYAIDSTCHVFWLTTIYSFLRNFSGFLNCFVFGLANAKIKQLFIRSWGGCVGTLIFMIFSPLLCIPVLLATGAVEAWRCVWRITLWVKKRMEKHKQKKQKEEEEREVWEVESRFLVNGDSEDLGRPVITQSIDSRN